jgi:carbon-monoxide dehydrogenase medium subunit
LATALNADEVITGIQLPTWPASRRWAFDEFAIRRGDFALAGIGLFFDLDGNTARNLHIAAFGIGDTPVRLIQAEAILEGRGLTEARVKDCCKAAQADIDPKADNHGSAAYRRSLIDHLLAKTLRHAMNNSVED